MTSCSECEKSKNNGLVTGTLFFFVSSPRASYSSCALYKMPNLPHLANIKCLLCKLFGKLPKIRAVISGDAIFLLISVQLIWIYKNCSLQRVLLPRHQIKLQFYSFCTRFFPGGTSGYMYLMYKSPPPLPPPSPNPFAPVLTVNSTLIL